MQIIETQLKMKAPVQYTIVAVPFHTDAATGALWADIKFSVKHFSDIERLAMVGDKKWEQGMATFCKPFTGAKIRYFDQVKHLRRANGWRKHRSQ